MPQPFVPAPQCVKAALGFTWASQNVQTILHFLHATPPSVADMLALGTYLGTTYWNTFLSSCSTNIALQQVVVTDLTTNISPSAIYTPAAPVPGTGASSSVSLNDAWVFSKRTALRGRNYRGRLYMPGITSGVQTGAGTGDLTTLAGIASSMVSRLITSMLANWTFGVLSNWLGNIIRPSGVFTPVTAISVNNVLDSQRRRLIGRGN